MMIIEWKRRYCRVQDDQGFRCPPPRLNLTAAPRGRRACARGDYGVEGWEGMVVKRRIVDTITKEAVAV